MDKGKRILVGIDALGWRNAPKFLMFLDDDDFLHQDLAKHISINSSEENGFVISKGYEWNEGGSWLYKLNDFDKKCGSSIIVNRSKLDLPVKTDDVALSLIDRWYGSHILLRADFYDRGDKLSEVPFRAAVYRLGGINSHSKASVVGLNRRKVSFRQLLRSLKSLEIFSWLIRRRFSIW